MSAKKRKPRKVIELGTDHPLIGHSFKVFVRTKFCAPIFGGKSIPTCPDDDFDMPGEMEEEKENHDQMENLSKWLIAEFAPWTVD